MTSTEDGNTETLLLDDGRTLAWISYGDPDGIPVLAMHGSPDSAVLWRLADTAAGSTGVRLIAPDRPGFGSSTPKRRRSILDWVDDLDALTDHLGLGRYRLLAISGGSPYALATAWRHPGRVEGVGLLSVIAPLDVPGIADQTSRPIRFTFFAARRFPFLLRPMATAMVRVTGRNIDAAAERLIKLRPPADRAVIRRPEVMAVLKANLPNQFNDPDSIATEMRNAARPWGFDLREVTAPTVIWQGGLDDVHPPAMAHHLARQLPRATLTYEPDYATFNFIDDFTDILATLRDTAA
ncbi:MAG: alpha/beta hydrolase [Acidimicrobiia bacterium]|nr:alpha/beta hydrolase [Acidimicrobiia bacterium]